MSFTEKINKIRNPKKDVIKYAFGKQIIDRMYIEVCSACQYNCQYCCHKEMIEFYNDYHLTLEELDRFLYYTKKSNYFFREVCIHGSGEPTLWKHLNEGIRVLHDSEVVGGILLGSNGVSIGNIEENTFEYIDQIRISGYPDAKKNDRLISLQKSYPEKIKINDIKMFLEVTKVAHLGTIPCKCICPLPMFIKDKIFYCNGAVFEAAKLKGVNILDCHEVYCELKEDYMKGYMFDKKRNYDLCQYCSYNDKIAKNLKCYPHKIRYRK